MISLWIWCGGDGEGQVLNLCNDPIGVCSFCSTCATALSWYMSPFEPPFHLINVVFVSSWLLHGFWTSMLIQVLFNVLLAYEYWSNIFLGGWICKCECVLVHTVYGPWLLVLCHLMWLFAVMSFGARGYPLVSRPSVQNLFNHSWTNRQQQAKYR